MIRLIVDPFDDDGDNGISFCVFMTKAHPRDFVGYLACHCYESASSLWLLCTPSKNSL